MAIIAVDPILLGECKLTFGTDDYEAHVSSAAFTPQNNSPVTWKGLTPTARFSKTPRADWTLDLELAQDWETAAALSRYLFENEGTDVSVVFEPVDGGASATATVSIAPGTIGGAVDTIPTSTVSMGSTRPVLSAVA